MSEMVERVAIAIARSRGLLPRSDAIPQEALWLYFPKEQAFKEARAAIEAMREPTKKMVDAGQDADNGENRNLGERGAKEAWQLMIDAALGK